MINRQFPKVLEDIKLALPRIGVRSTLSIGVIGVLVLYLLSGIYVVNPGEEAVIRRFGKYTGERIGEGIHYRLPWPIDRIDKVNIQEIRRHSLGMVFPAHPESICPPEAAEVLTGDENIVDAKLMIQYRVKDPAKYLFNLRYEDPHRSVHRFIKDTARAAIVSLIGNMTVDEALTIGKSLLQRMIQTEAQKLLDRYHTGLQIVTVNLETVYPPEEVADAFRDVVSAKEEREEKINQAGAYRNTVIPDAEGRAYRLLEDAKAYNIKVINEAKGDAENFISQLKEYQKDVERYSREVTDYRLYIETMEKVLPRVKFYIVDTKNEGQKVNLRFLKQQD
ncbi:MAG: FtsH protease activity modulator HflK [bacterium]